MRKFKKILSVAMIMMLVLTMLPTSVFAAGSYTAYASKTTLTVGNSTNLVISAKNAAGKFTVTSSNPAVATVSKASTWVDGSTMDNKITIKGVKAGTATITVTPTNVSDNEYNLLTKTTTIKITVKAATTNNDKNNNNKNNTTTVVKKSSDATLKSLTSDVVDLGFSKNKTSYMVSVAKSVTSLNLKAVANHAKAKVKITGDSNFKVGQNTVKVLVTAEDGTTKTYTVTVVKSNLGAAPLLDLKVKGYELSPKFDPAVYTYVVNAEDITSVELEYVLADADSKVEVQGADNLKVGQNTVKVIVTEEDGAVTTYTVLVNVAASSSSMVWLILVIVLVVLIAGETVYIVVKRKKEATK